jgi:hypothetical protein
VYDETLPTIYTKPSKKGGNKRKFLKGPMSKKTNDPAKRGDQVLGSFVCRLPSLSVFDVSLFTHLLVSDYLLKILDFLETSFYYLFNTCVTMVVDCKLNIGTYQFPMSGSWLEAQ